MWDGPQALMPPYSQSHSGGTAREIECHLLPCGKPKLLTGANSSSLCIYLTLGLYCETLGRELVSPSPGTCCLFLKVEERLSSRVSPLQQWAVSHIIKRTDGLGTESRESKYSEATQCDIPVLYFFWESM